ncbi:agmatinase [Roseococcus sp. YIM B11640]|uniref:agmatinase n=1 Tax=Roseococcus sp. YIM B11640 TaxID=3133973 RepID=UPI003C7E1E3D
MTDDTPRPVDGLVTPRFAAPATFMRLPLRDSAEEIDIALLGIPFDGAVTNRPGTRHGPRALRDASCLMRRVHPVSLIEPYRLCRIADLGDAETNPVDVMATLKLVEERAAKIRSTGAWVFGVGGDHLMSLPLLRALKRAAPSTPPLGMVHFDAHSDTTDTYFGGTRYTHGTPFRRAIEEGLLDPRRVVQIGIRGSLYERDDMAYAESVGIRIIRIEECEELGPDGIAAEARRVTAGGPTYLTFDIDSLDPAFAPGTGTPEVGGLTPREAMRILRGLRGIPLVGADLVEVSPPFDPGGNTAMVGATMMFEILCLLAEARAAY